MSETADHAKAGAHEDGHGGDHVVPAVVFHGVFVALLILTAVTCYASTIDMGRSVNIVVALGIAVVKASLVGAFFMHLKWDKPFNAVVILVSVGFLVLFLGISTLDTAENEWRKDPGFSERWIKNQHKNENPGFSRKTDLGGPPPADGSGG